MGTIAQTLNQGGFDTDTARRAVAKSLNVTNRYAEIGTIVTYNNTAALAAIPQLSLTLDANSVYVFRYDLTLSIAAAANNIQFDFNGGTVVASSVVGTARFSLANGTALLVPITALNTAISGGTTNAWIRCEIDLRLRTSIPGFLIPRGAQAAAAATASSITVGSWVEGGERA